MKKTGLFFGTFNPIHIGHLVIANHLVEFSDLEEVWFVITPKSPCKARQSLLSQEDRYQMIYEAVRDYPKLKPSRIEFTLPQPNYTLNTLVHLEEKHEKKYQFSLILGEDNLKNFPKWKNYNAILDHYTLYVYPRMLKQKAAPALEQHPNIIKINAPIMEISSSFIRKAHQDGKNIRPLLPLPVWNYIDRMNFYK